MNALFYLSGDSCPLIEPGPSPEYASPLHFMCAFLGKAWIRGQFRVIYNGQLVAEDEFHHKKVFAAFTNGKGQLKGDINFLAGDILKKTLKALKNVA